MSEKLRTGLYLLVALAVLGIGGYFAWQLFDFPSGKGAAGEALAFSLADARSESGNTNKAGSNPASRASSMAAAAEGPSARANASNGPFIG